MYNKHEIKSKIDPLTKLPWAYYEEYVKKIYPNSICINHYVFERLHFQIITMTNGLYLLGGPALSKTRMFSKTAWKNAYLRIKKKELPDGL